jgi:hypothetical protein
MPRRRRQEFEDVVAVGSLAVPAGRVNQRDVEPRSVRGLTRRLSGRMIFDGVDHVADERCIVARQYVDLPGTEMLYQPALIVKAV